MENQPQTLARAPKQELLLDVPPVYKISNNANARNAYGSAAQDIICSALGLFQIPIDGRKTTCFDAEGANGDFWEIKSVKRSGKVVIYDWRMNKEAGAGVPLFYAILVHRISGFRDGSLLVNEISINKPSILVLPSSKIHQLAIAEKLNTVKSTKELPVEDVADRSILPRNGYTRAGYDEGYRNVPVKNIRAACGPTIYLSFEVHGVKFKEVEAKFAS